MKIPSEIMQHLCMQFKNYKPKTLPAYKKLYEILRQQILEGTILPGMCLPSSRILASTLSIARNTVLTTIDQLCSEGYAKTKEKSGVYILATVPIVWDKHHTVKSSFQVGLSNRGKFLYAQAHPHTHRSGFAVGIPDLNEFPFALWQRYFARHAKNPKLEWLTNSQQGGDLELRKILADYLRMVRGIRCDPKQILITYGTQHSLQLIADLLADPGDHVWMENPGYAGARSAFAAAALTIINQPIDAEGMLPRQQDWKKPPRFIYTTPSHQFPTGVLMTAARRRQLVTTAAQHGSCIIEDDYDSEFCYETAPVAALQALAPNQVIYLGTFNKLFFPTFHVGYMVLPEYLVDAFSAIQTRHTRGPSLITQKALADFMKEGHASAYIRKMCRIYQIRRDTLNELLLSELGNLISISGTDAGLHLVAHLPKRFNDNKLANTASELGIVVNPLSRYYDKNEKDTKAGLVLGFGNIDQRDIIRLGKRLCEIIHSQCKSKL